MPGECNQLNNEEDNEENKFSCISSMHEREMAVWSVDEILCVICMENIKVEILTECSRNLSCIHVDGV